MSKKQLPEGIAGKFPTPAFSFTFSVVVAAKNVSQHSDVASPKFFWGEECLTLGEHLYFLWDTASQSKKWLDMLKNWGGKAPWLRLCVSTDIWQSKRGRHSETNVWILREGACKTFSNITRVGGNLRNNGTFQKNVLCVTKTTSQCFAHEFENSWNTSRCKSEKSLETSSCQGSSEVTCELVGVIETNAARVKRKLGFRSFGSWTEKKTDREQHDDVVQTKKDPLYTS